MGGGVEERLIRILTWVTRSATQTSGESWLRWEYFGNGLIRAGYIGTVKWVA